MLLLQCNITFNRSSIHNRLSLRYSIVSCILTVPHMSGSFIFSRPGEAREVLWQRVYCAVIVRLNRAALHELEKDTADKFICLNLDQTSRQFRNTSRGIHYQDGIERVDNTSVPLSATSSILPYDIRYDRRVNPLTLTVAVWQQWPSITKHSVPDRVKPSFVIFDIRALRRLAVSVRVPGCQKLQMMA